MADLKIWLVHPDDPYHADDGYVMLVAALDEERAMTIWREHYADDDALVCASPAKWEWDNVWKWHNAIPEPEPTEEGVWFGGDSTGHGDARCERGELFRGYGCYYLEDPTCDDCGDRFNEKDGTHDDFGFICDWCSEDRKVKECLDGWSDLREEANAEVMGGEE